MMSSNCTDEKYWFRSGLLCQLQRHSLVAEECQASSAAAPAAAQAEPEPEPSAEGKTRMLAALQKIRSHIGHAAKREKAVQLLCKLLADDALSVHYRDATFQVLTRPRSIRKRMCCCIYGGEK